MSAFDQTPRNGLLSGEDFNTEHAEYAEMRRFGSLVKLSASSASPVFKSFELADGVSK
jgi:hypothetical protein